MILKFPQPFPDETFYSWIARYHDQSANVLPQATISRIYGDFDGCAIYGMPTGVNQLCKRLLPLIIYSPEEIIESHTLLPYFSLVLTPQRLANTRDKMLESINTGVQGQLGSLASTIKNFRYLRYCPLCLTEDRKYMGEAYWHRTHQLPGVLICPFHNVPTLNSQVDKQNTQHQHYASAELYAKPLLRQLNITSSDKLLWIAEESSRLLREKPAASFQTYREELLNLGFNQGTFIDQKKLADEFIAFWEPQLLRDIGIRTNLRSQSNWLRFMTRKTQKGSQFQPLQHILVQIFIREVAKISLPVSSSDKFSPQTHYVCSNPFCDQEEKKSAVLEQTYQKQKNGSVYGIIRCLCGYALSGNLEASQLYKSHVISYGSTWKKRFIRYVEAGYTIPQMIDVMSVSRGTIIRRVMEYGLQPDWPVLLRQKNHPRDYIFKRITKERKTLLEYRKKHPDHSRVQIRKGMNAAYKFLSRRDKVWFNKQLPAFKKPSSRPSRIDWKKRDREYLRQVKTIVREFLSLPGKPRRVTPCIISKTLGKKNLFTKISAARIPKTMAYLQDACHPNHHHKRRLEWAREQLKHEGQTITRSNLIYTACLSYELTLYQEQLLEEMVSASNDASYFEKQNNTGKT